MAARPDEIAVLLVNGLKFEDWDSIWVQRQRAAAWSWFRFTAAERDPVFTKQGSPQWLKLQFKPGDQCTITLAGELAITGFIEQRDVGYDANQHQIMLIGKSNTAAASRSSVDTKTGSFDNKTIEQAARECFGTYGCDVKTIGQVDATPFKRLHVQRGELTWDFIERLSRMRNAILGSDAFGNFLLIGPHRGQMIGQLIEGLNMQSCHCTITHEHARTEMNVGAQTPATDDLHGTQASEVEATSASAVPNQQRRSKVIVPMEHPPMAAPQHEVQMRADYEKMWRDGTLIQCTAVVQGWLRDGKSLWHEGDLVHVYSPMAMLDEDLTIFSVTFTQDNRTGTTTTLVLVNPAALNQSPTGDVGPQQPNTAR
jgi:prophage tail gpP-like protein